jgi:hypothetical protein
VTCVWYSLGCEVWQEAFCFCNHFDRVRFTKTMDSTSYFMLTFVGDYFYINNDSTYYGTLPNKELKAFYPDLLKAENIVK